MAQDSDISEQPYSGPAILIAGPTASGKSALALWAAQTWDGAIINADAIQVYSDLNILSARPGGADLQAAPHHLYGVLKGDERCSAGRWAGLARAAITAAAESGKLPIIVGGTGLYFRALTKGLSPIPAVDDKARKTAQMRLKALGQDGFYAEVVAQDPAMARLAPGDTQRLLRAWEVYHSTGAPLSHFQAVPGAPLIAGKSLIKLVLAPIRETLYQRCEQRFDQMLAAGALDEARGLLAQGLSQDLPVMKAVGAAELMAHLRGEITFDEARALAKQNTRRFAKRQLTWFRNQTADWECAQTQQLAREYLDRAMLQCEVAPNRGN